MYRVPAAGGGVAERTRVADAGEGSATLSPDGSQFLYVAQRVDETAYDLMVAGVDGSGPRIIATGIEPGARWSPSGAHILYSDGASP